MEYPITVEQIAKIFEKTNGYQVPDSKHQLLADFVDLLNSAYQSGFAIGESHTKGAA